MVKRGIATTHVRSVSVTVAAVALVCYSLFTTRIPRNLVVQYSHTLAPLVQQTLLTQLTPELCASLDCKKILTHLRSSMPAVKQVTIRILQPWKARITISASTPIARINTDQVLTEENTLVPRSQYRTSSISSLPEIMVLEKQITHKVTRDISRFIAKLPPKLSEMYRFIWHNKTVIEWQPYQPSPLSLISWTDTEYTPALLKALEQLAPLLEKRTIHQKKRPLQWRVDTRQPHYLMVTPLTKGVS